MMVMGSAVRLRRGMLSGGADALGGMGVRRKLFVVCLSFLLVTGGLGGLWLESRLRNFLEGRIEARLLDRARTVQSHLEAVPTADDVRPWFAEMGPRAEARVTVILSDGTVLADTAVADPSSLDNHSNRPELHNIDVQGYGLARRHSDSINTDMLYLAVSICKEQTCANKLLEGGFVRASMPLASVEALVDQLRRLLGLAGLFAIGLAICMSWLASHFLSRALQRLVEHTRVLVGGKGHRIDVLTTDEIGRLAGNFNQLADELEHAMASLAIERGRFEAILDSMSEAVLVLDDRQDILLINPATSRLLDLEHPPIGQPLAASVVAPELEQLARSGAEGPCQAEFTFCGHQTRRVLARATPLEERDTGGTVIVMHDVTEVRRLENIRKDFVANVSHELRTPVSIVQANAETLLDGALDDPIRARTFVEALHRNAERLSRIIADLLDLSRLEAGKYNFDLTGVDVEEVVAAAIESVEHRAQTREQTIDVALTPHHTAIADIKALEQVVTNLLENAIKYTPSGGHIWIRSEERNDQVRIEVQDDGPGIKPEHRLRIFERFYRIDAGRSRDMGGTGLGLAIVKHFVESMGGTVGVEEAFPRGSIFWLTIPADTTGERAPTPLPRMAL